MKRFFYAAIVSLLFSFVGCSDYDDSALTNRVDDLEDRVSKLEALCREMNTNISSLHGIIQAMQENDYITDVSPIVEGGKTVGYRISFAKGESIDIYNGKDGEDGAPGEDGKDASDLVPTIGVKRDSDGIYYWTLDGEWLLDAQGNKVPAQGRDGEDGAAGEDGEDGLPGAPGQDGQDGQDGVTPQLKIADDYWYISYNNGMSWTKLGKATGEDGEDGIVGGDSIFSSVTQDENFVYFELGDGTVLTVAKGAPLSIEFDEADLVVMSPNSTRKINYTVSSVIEPVKVAVTSSADIKAKVVADNDSSLKGYIQVSTSEQIDEYSQVIVFVSNGDKVIMQTIAFEQSGLEVYDNATHVVDAEGGEVTFSFMTNVACEVELPADVSWISVLPDTRAMELHTATLKVEANTGITRSCSVLVRAKDEPKLSISYTISQKSANIQSNQIRYVTTDAKKVAINDEAMQKAVISHTYSDGCGVITFDSSLTTIGDMAFAEAENLKSMILPEGIESIGVQAFVYCSSLTHIELPEGLASIGDYAFYGCSAIESLHIPASVQSFGVYPFYQCSGELTLSCNLADVSPVGNQIYADYLPFYGSYFTSLTFDEHVTHIGDFSCFVTTSLRRLEIGENVELIGTQAFYSCDGLVGIVCKAVNPPALYSWAFNEGVTIRVPDDSVMEYKNHSMWGQYNIMGINEEAYTSTDYSADGLVTILQKATEGNGVDVVIMGDAYSDRQIASGFYEEDMTMAIEHLFSEEPYKSFRHLFNVQMVTAVSAHEGYGLGDTALSGYFGEGTHVGGNDEAVFNYALKAIDAERMDEALIVVIMNRRYYAGTCWMYYPEGGDYGNGVSISYFPFQDREQLRSIILHEAGGHGFAKLADEYAYEEYGTVPASEVESMHYIEQYGWYKNIDFTSNTATIKWSNFISDRRYAFDGLGAFEGAATYWKGVWRPTENSNMRHNEGGFNAPSRAAIYNRIHKLAYGESWEFDYEEFVAYDAINRKSIFGTAATQPYVYDFEPLHEPIIVKKKWTEVVR